MVVCGLHCGGGGGGGGGCHTMVTALVEFQPIPQPTEGC